MKLFQILRFFFFISFILVFKYSRSQTAGVAINTDGAVANTLSLLDIKSTSQGVLIPRMTTAQRNAIGPNIPSGLWVYDTDTKSFWYNQGSATVGNGWVQILTSYTSGWLTTGNSNTNDATHFIGTTDDRPFNIRVNGWPSGRIESASGYNNTFLGYQAGTVITLGPPSALAKDNTAFGYSALMNNTNNSNMAIGSMALQSNTSGSS